MAAASIAVSSSRVCRQSTLQPPARNVSHMSTIYLASKSSGLIWNIHIRIAVDLCGISLAVALSSYIFPSIFMGRYASLPLDRLPSLTLSTLQSPARNVVGSHTAGIHISHYQYRYFLSLWAGAQVFRSIFSLWHVLRRYAVQL